MKRIINWFLLLGTIISAGVALKFSALPVPAFLPDSWAEFWISSAEEQQRYVLLYDIAVGFIMSAYFKPLLALISAKKLWTSRPPSNPESLAPGRQ